MTFHIPKIVLRWLDDHKILRQLMSLANYLCLDKSALDEDKYHLGHNEWNAVTH